MSTAVVLPIELEPQQGDRLCWAAVAVSLRRYYRHGAPMDQVGFARSLLGDRYDRPCPPLVALLCAGLHYEEQEGPEGQAEVLAQLRAGHPVLVAARYFVGWHLLLIHGHTSDDRLIVADPLYGASSWPYEQFAQGYRTHYVWTHTYRLKRLVARCHAGLAAELQFPS
jgi:hypothetical protein